jgi:phosphopantetheine--protein transferase-like protein
LRSIGNGPIGAGIDLVSWSRIARFLADHPKESLKRLLTPREQLAFQKTSEPVSFFARSFAAKEAFFKARGDSLVGEASFREVEVLMQGEERFQIARRNDTWAEGQFFKSPNGIGAKILIWENSKPEDHDSSMGLD